MPKISDLIKDAEAKGGPWLALEFFPPRTPEGVANLYKRFKIFQSQSGCIAVALRVRVAMGQAPDSARPLPAPFPAQIRCMLT
jgi:hypothetical protein